MSKLPTRLTYIKRCGFCKHDETYIMRDTNVNTNITDEDAIKMAQTYLGEVDTETCENCRYFTEHKRVAYVFREEA